MRKDFIAKSVSVFVAMVLLSTAILVGIPYQSVAAATTYNRDAAVNWANSHNQDGVCTTLVTKAMQAGGIPVETYNGNNQLAKWLQGHQELWEVKSSKGDLKKGDLLFWNQYVINTDLTTQTYKGVTNWIDHVILITGPNTYTQWAPQKNDKDLSWVKNGMLVSDEHGTNQAKYIMGVHFKDTVPPTPPSGLTVTDVKGGYIQLDWIDNSNDEEYFRVYDGSNLINNISNQNWVMARFDGIGSHCYTVSAVNASGESAQSPSACFSYGPSAPTPVPPRNSGQTLGVSSTPTQFLGNPSSKLKDNGGSADLKVCADNIVGQTVYVVFSRPGKEWSYNKKATSRCVTFTNMDGSGPLNGNTLYVSRAALNQQPQASWSSTSCYAGNSNQQGLCDTVRKNNK